MYNQKQLMHLIKLIIMKNIISLAIVLFCFTASEAQQEQQYTQFMFNKMSFNPAVAGSSNASCLTVLNRSQWIGFDGAPNAQLVTFNMPFMNGRVGAGGQISRQSIGVDRRVTMDAVYAYRIPFATGSLALGLQASVRYRGINFNDPRVISTTPLSQDNAIQPGFQSKLLPNVGFGAYYNSETYYLGASIPRVIKNNLGFGEGTTPLSREAIHGYFMGGIVMILTDKLKLQPQTMIKIAANSPTVGEANVNLIYMDKFTTGLTYRSGGSSKVGIGEALCVLFSVQATDKFLLGMSYDYTMSELRNNSTGSFELALRYCFKKAEGNQYVNPRFF